jgi:hypothetical protein
VCGERYSLQITYYIGNLEAHSVAICLFLNIQLPKTECIQDVQCDDLTDPDFV